MFVYRPGPVVSRSSDFQSQRCGASRLRQHRPACLALQEKNAAEAEVFVRSGGYPRGRPKPAGGAVSLMQRETWDQLMKVIGTEESSLAGAETESQLDQRQDAGARQPTKAIPTLADLRPSRS